MSTGQANRLKLRREKRGVVLLVVVSILTLFLMIGITYVLVAGNYQAASVSNLRAQRYGDEPEREAEEVIGQLLYGSVSPLSVIAPHNLLADLYGSDGIIGTIGSVTTQNNGQTQVLTFQFQLTDNSQMPPQPRYWPPFNRQFATSNHYYAGRVVTYLDGSAAGYSSRVMAYYISNYDSMTDTYTANLCVEAPESGLPISVVPSANNRFLINGAPFNGTGFGLDPSTGNIDLTDPTSGYLVALQPNFAAYPSFYALGGADESWDAPDFQNMPLSMVPPGRAIDSTLPIIPSFHRPELVNYWWNGKMIDPTTPAGQQLFSRVILRPMPWDHPNFSGSNPAFGTTNLAMNAAVNGPWDVDNDGDGIAESIWIDPGLPVVTAPNGRRYKRLVAICVKDLDGRININAAGNLSQITQQYRSDQPTQQVMGLAPTGTNLAHGLGYGPGELDFMHIFGGYPGGLATYTNVLTMRYGNDGQPGQANTREGLHVVKHHGLPNDFQNNSQQPSWYATPPDVWGRGAIALDTAGQPVTFYMGQTGEALDTQYEFQLDAQHSSYDAPYTVAELEHLLRYHDLGSQTLAWRLGAYFNGSSPGTPDAFQQRREVVTTMSSSLPVPMMAIPKGNSALPSFDFRTNQTVINAGLNQGSVTLLDLYRAKLLAGGVANVNAEINNIVPWEIRHGQLFDLNRFLGNGYDDDGNSTRDEVFEEFGNYMGGPEPAWIANNAVPTQFQGISAWHQNDMPLTDLNGDMTVDANDAAIQKTLCRHYYARHLFCLMMLLKDQFPPMATEMPALTQTQQDQLAARKIAQWAINVVDFRDADAIMTPFEYDENPFNGWSVDGIVGSSDDNQPDRRLVWGCESPDLVLGEVYACHDKRLKDTGLDPSKHKRGDKKPDDDPDLDQFRIPQGSLFVEMYCPKARQNNNQPAPNNQQTNPIYQQELYSYDAMSQRWYLDLARIHQTPDGNGVRHPVWRIAISQNHVAASNAQNSAFTRGLSNYESTTFDPNAMNAIDQLNAQDQLNDLSTSPSQLIIERQIWFANYDPPAGTPEAGKVFSNSASAFAPVYPGQYAVVGPRVTTYLGSAELDGDPYGTPWDDNSPQAITLSPSVSVLELSGAPSMNASNALAAVGIIADAPPPAGWGNQTQRIGVNVTEPLPQNINYYQEPNFNNPPGAYDNQAIPNYTVPDRPFDYDISLPAGSRPLIDGNMTKTNLYENCNSLFLQRLANPMIPWNAVTNPYITVDWATADVNVFNGEEDINRKITDSMGKAQPIDPSDPGVPNPLRFGARQRGQNSNQPNYNIWYPYADVPGQVAPGGGVVTPYVNYNFENTLGYLNVKFQVPMPGGDPQFPFPWLTWNNRPYMNPMELLMVPSSAPGRLCHESQNMTAVNGPARTTSPYNPSGVYSPPFTHIPNFYLSSYIAGPGGTPQFVRLLNCVEVPSPYTYTEKWYNPTQTPNSQHFGDPNVATTDVAITYRPPFNKLSRFRDPGKININTVFDYPASSGGVDVLRAVTNQLPDLNPNFLDKLLRSRQGYPGQLYTTNPDYPTRFANPFRSPDSSDIMPDIGSPRNMRTAPVEATLLRSDPDVAPASPNQAADVPLVGNQPFAPLTHTYNQPDRNAYFATQDFQKLGSVFTTQSNCYAVWLTIGYFEVEQNPNGVDQAHPDGLRLAQEVGVDSGEVKRRRAFYIIDRSIPVGYEPGHRHNTDKAILLKRFIE